jgi:hypothetical protein
MDMRRETKEQKLQKWELLRTSAGYTPSRQNLRIVLTENISVVCITKVTGLNTINSVKISVFHAGFQSGSFFDPEDGGDMFLRDFR